MWTFELYQLMCLAVFFVLTDHCRAQEIDIECIPLEDCPVAMKLVATKKFAPETIQFLKQSHCGYSKNKAPLVWCPNLKSCTTPDGKIGTCTDIVNCESLINVETTTNFITEYRCNRYLRNRVSVCCPMDTEKMQNRFMASDEPDLDDSYIFDKSDSSAKSSSSSEKHQKKNIFSNHHLHPSNKQEFLHNRFGKDYPKHRHHDPDHGLNHNYYTHTNQNGGFPTHRRREEFEIREKYDPSYVVEDSRNSLEYDDHSRNHLSPGEKTSSGEDIHYGQGRRGGNTESYNDSDEYLQVTKDNTWTSRTFYWTTQATNPHRNRQTTPSTRKPFGSPEFSNVPKKLTPTSNRKIWNEQENNSNNHENNKTNFFEGISEICGRQTANDNKIIGGTDADLGEYPWMALLQYTSSNGKKFGCGGSLISKRHVLTAAHCVNTAFLKEKRLNLYNVILGEYDTRNETDCIYMPFGKDCADPPRIYGVDSIIEHKQFSSANATDDIALIVLDRDVDFTDYIKPICLPPNTFTMQTNESLSVAGWGKTTATGSSSPILKKAKLPKVEKGACDQFGKSLTRGQMCAGFGNGIDTCTGDSGGPLMLSRPQNFEFVTYQIGLVSYGFVADGCGSAPSVNTFVPYYVDWIKDNVS